jgi:hypothetical protein
VSTPTWVVALDGGKIGVLHLVDVRKVKQLNPATAAGELSRAPPPSTALQSSSLVRSAAI